jgi:hypothetical protein
MRGFALFKKKVSPRHSLPGPTLPSPKRSSGFAQAGHGASCYSFQRVWGLSPENNCYC